MRLQLELHVRCQQLQVFHISNQVETLRFMSFLEKNDTGRDKLKGKQGSPWGGCLHLNTSK